MLINKLREKIKSYFQDADLELLTKAYEFAAKAHEGQKRNSGEPYIMHPLRVAYTLAELELDVTCVAAGLLHDVVEDTPVTMADIEKQFGTEIALIVDGVTKLSRLEYKSKEEQQAENLRKMFLAMAKDMRVILIKLADRLHNMQTLKYQSPAKQLEIAKETIEIYAPLAHRLGIFRLKWELEDLALRYLEPARYYELVEKIAQRRQEREEYINQVIVILKQHLDEVEIKADISGRPKNFYSIYQKMEKQGKDISEIFDLTAIRVLVDNVKDCYGALGICHTLWKPLPGRFKDYIAMPKPNMYQSLHTTVIGPRGEPFEIQIRTWDMHRTAEYGIAAHWVYKSGRGDKDFGEKYAWLRQILEWQLDLRDAHEFMESLKIDLFSDTVFVFTPKGDVIELPAGSVPIDFAYRVHSEVGNRCVGAKVSGRIVPLDYRLNNGDIVEILTSKQASGPSRDWLNLVKTSQAKSRIRAWFKKEQREENIVRGREVLEREIKKQGTEMAEWSKGDRLLEAAKRFNFLSVEELYAAVGAGTLTALQVLGKIKEEFQKDRKQGASESEMISDTISRSEKRRSSQGVQVLGVDNLMVRFAHCCNPLPGDPIVGYITRGRGVTIHRADCPNMLSYQKHEPHRVTEAKWEKQERSTYQVEIEVVAMDRPRLTIDIVTMIADTKTIINAVHARARKDKTAAVNLKIEISSLEHLEHIMQRVRRVRDVTDVRRVVPS